MPRVELEQHPLAAAGRLAAARRCARSGRHSRARRGAPSAPRSSMRRRPTRSSASVRRARRSAAQLSPSRTSRACSATSARSAGSAPALGRQRLRPAAVGREEAAAIFGEQPRALGRAGGEPARDGRGRARRPLAAARAALRGRAAGRRASCSPSAQARRQRWRGSSPGSAPRRARCRPACLEVAGRVPGGAAAAAGWPSSPRRASRPAWPRPASRPGPATARPRRSSRRRLASTCARASGISSLRRALVDGLEMRRHPGLEREPPQQRAAQRVDGHDAQPARQLQHLREQPARPVEQRCGIGRGSPVSSAARAASVGIVGSAAQAASRSSIRRRHLRRRGLGEGEAEDAFGVRRRRAAAASTRSVSTRVLPVPALAVTQTERRGSAARRWAGVGGGACAHGLALRRSRHSPIRARCS